MTESFISIYLQLDDIIRILNKIREARMDSAGQRRVVITGGSGLIGRRLTEMLRERGYQVSVITRNKNAKSPESYYWNYQEGVLDQSALEGAYGVIHLAGAGVGDRGWSKSRKKEIIESRVQTTELLVKKIAEVQSKPAVFISASAVGYYGDRKDEVLTESSGSGEGFLSTTVTLWEEAVQKINTLGIRMVILRTGVVLDKNHGALPKMAGPVKAMIGSPLGSGKQYLPWIHLDDICRMYIHALEHDTIHGVFNAVAPEEQTNESFTGILGKTLHRPVILPAVPVFVLRLILGEMSHLVLDSNRVRPDRILNTGFRFLYPELGRALNSIYQSVP